MDDGFRDYYQQGIEVHTRRLERNETGLREALEASVDAPPPDPYGQEAVRVAIASAQETAKRLSLDLRPDAELVLFLLADEIVAKPVATVTPEEAPDLPEVLRADAETLVINAERSANDGEVSAHAIVDSLSRSWGELQSARFRFWDRTGGNPAKSSAGELKPSGQLDVDPGEEPAGGAA
jgi:hypothetical protein